jgi:hypothetical protein
MGKERRWKIEDRRGKMEEGTKKREDRRWKISKLFLFSFFFLLSSFFFLHS